MASPLKPSPARFGIGFYRVCVALWLFVVICITARPAYAYVDPGSGLFLLQVVGSTLVGIPFLIRRRIRQVFERFGRNRKIASDTNAPR
ncbi:MAG TPA: hypothetical protein VKR52_08505 [Terracidiphilus sp.]|nr:hypothetical protein [Terracidiphilus sp.]